MKPTAGANANAPSQICRDAISIWQAGIDAVKPANLIPRVVQVNGGLLLTVGDQQIDLASLRRIVVVGAGKASGAMAAAVVSQLISRLPNAVALLGWVNVPDNCVCDAGPVRVFPCRPPGVNLPTEAAIHGTQEIVRLISKITDDDLCLCLISGGGSALLALPVPGITLGDKQRVTKLLSNRKASIQQLNRVRRQISQVKGGRLLDHLHGGRLVTLVVSDVLGDPLDLIASGPTVRATGDTARSAIEVFRELAIPLELLPINVIRHLRGQLDGPTRATCETSAKTTNLLIGNLQMAIDAALVCAQQLGYECSSEIQSTDSVLADDEGIRLARWIETASRRREKLCLLSGGEPVVELCKNPGLGGRNQQLAAAGLNRLLGQAELASGCNFCLLSAGTDGEDGVTTAAGGYFDRESVVGLRLQRVNPAQYLERNDAFSFFNKYGGLFLSGPTGTNVGDVRVALVDR